MTKSEQRAELRVRRRRFVLAHGSNQFYSNYFSVFLDKYIKTNSNIVSFFRASATECDVSLALSACTEAGDRLALPWGNSKADPIIFRQWKCGDPLETSQLGFDQPLETASEVTPDIILTPLLGFDRSLRRLGQGAGHYDRAFARFPAALRIGIAWACQEVGEIPCDPWDVPLDAVLTEEEWISVPSSRLDLLP